MITSYLADFVQDNPRVIIPNLGAFLTRYKTLDKTTFSPFLRFNDGLLENHVVQMEGITLAQAGEKIAMLVGEIKKTIAEKRFYYIDKMGILYEDAHGLVQFLRASNEQLAQQKFQEIMADAAIKKQYQPIDGIVPKRAFGEANASQHSSFGTLTPQHLSYAPPIPIVAQKVREIDAATQSLEEWIKTVENRRGSLSATTDEDSDTKRRQEEIERALKLRQERESLDVDRDDILPTYTRKKSRGLLWLGCIFFLSGIIAGMLWFSEDLLIIYDDIVKKVEQSNSRTSTLNNAPYTPKIVDLEQGIFYVAIANFSSLDEAVAFCYTLNEWGLSPEIVTTMENSAGYIVVLYKSSIRYEAEKHLHLQSKKYGKGWLLSS
ncbi:MAG: hypothetical protein ACRCSB_03485 [Bacteroidales bacterium]